MEPSTKSQNSRALNYSLLDGAFFAGMSALTSGVFLTGFAISLGANNFQIGVLASLPLLADVFQFPASYYVDRLGGKKKLCLYGSMIGRLFWLFIAVFPLISFSWLRQKQVLLLIIFVALYSVFTSISRVGWLSWIADLVPESIRGRFFSKRNVVVGLATMGITLLGGKYTKHFTPWFTPDHNLGFSPLFVGAFLLGCISLIYLKKMPETSTNETANKKVLSSFLLPFKDRNFNRLLFFSLWWGFAVNVASPFFTVYMLTELQLSYDQIALFTALNAGANLLSLWGWGLVSDRFGNKPVMLFSGALAASLPFLWMFTNPKIIYFIIFLHILGGYCWAGFNLAAGNILLKLSPIEHNTLYFGAYGFLVSLSSALGPLVGGWLLHWALVHRVSLILWPSVFHLIFLLSSCGRVLSLYLLRKVHEPAERPASEMIRFITNPRRLSTMLGFQPMVHHSLAMVRNRKGSFGISRILNSMFGNKPVSKD